MDSWERESRKRRDKLRARKAGIEVANRLLDKYLREIAADYKAALADALQEAKE